MGDTPNSSFHTQTLTQLLSEKGENGQEDDLLQIQDSEEEDEEDEEEEIALPLPKGIVKRKQSVQAIKHEEMKSKAAAHVPSTPSSKRIKVSLEEVPSSQPSPFTPPLFHRYGPLGANRSPLKERSTNVDAPLPTMETLSKTPKIPRDVVIQDSYSPGSSARFSSLPASSPKKEEAETTPMNKPRRVPLAELPMGSYDLGEGVGYNGDETPTRPRTGSARRVFMEIPDSDEELESVGPTPRKGEGTLQESQTGAGTGGGAEDALVTSSPHGAVSLPQTPCKIGSLAANPADQMNEFPPGTPVIYEDPASTPGDDGPVRAHGDKDPVSTPSVSESESEEALEPGTPTPVARRVQIQLPQSSAEEEILKETPRKVLPGKQSPIIQRHTQARSQFYSQGLESQRVPLDVIRNMGPQTDRSDILISIHPGPVGDIVAGTKDHEFRSYKFPDEATRCWIYTTRPVGEVRYMARLGPARGPGEINSLSGLGNAEFNNGELGNSRYAHELIQVYELNNPVPLAEMKDNGLGDTTPQKYRYIPPAVVGQLLGNLRCALFAEGNELDEDDEDEEDEGGHDVTISQELAEQIRSDILGSEQMAPPSSDAHEEIIPASQEEVPRTAKKTTGILKKTPQTVRRAPEPDTREEDIFARPGLPPLPPAGQRVSARVRSQRSQLQRVPSYGNGNGIRPSQATTVSCISSPGGSPARGLSSVPRPSTSFLPEVLREFEGEDGDSSPILRESATEMVMQDSLFVGEGDVRAPPAPLMGDSDEDE